MGIPRLLFPALLSVVGFAQTGGQVNVWIPRGPEGGVVPRRPVIDPQNPGTLYTGGFRTTDAAQHWSAFPRTPLAVDPQNSYTLYSFGSGCNLSKSMDGGLTWWNLGTAAPPVPWDDDPSLVFDPSNPRTLYFGCRPWGIFKSTDGGVTWSAANSGLPAENGYVPISALLIDPHSPSTLYAAAGWDLGLFKSTDGAASWNPIWNSADSGLPANRRLTSVAMDPQNTKTLYVVAALGMVAKSIDGGGSWAVVGSLPGSFGPRGLVVDPQDSGVLYASTDRGVEKSTDAGGSWSLVLSRAPSYPLWLAVAPAAGGPSAVYAGGDWRGILKSSDGGATWARANSGLIITSIDSLAIDPQNGQTLYVGLNGAGLFKTTDGAASWSPTPSLEAFYAVAVDPRNEGTVYAWDGNGVRKSVDGGQSWAKIRPVGDAGSLAIDTQSPDTLYYSYSSGGVLYQSMDGGAHWASLSGFPGFASVATDPQNSGTVYAGSVAGVSGGRASSMSSGVVKSTDGGQTWSGVNTLWRMVSVSKIVVDPSDASVVYAATTTFDCWDYICDVDLTDPKLCNALGLYKSSDGGATWVKLDVPGGADYTQLLGIDRQGALYVSSLNQFAKSQDGGATWNALPSTGLPFISTLAIDPLDSNHLFAGTYGRGLFEIRLAPQEK
jgi:photosystem II stability/assembly factor-like uncharacterized protein